jgi:hypothetical protein
VLEVWTLDELVFQKHKVRLVTLEAAQARLRREGTRREPWQRADETVASHEGVETLESEGGAVLFRRSGERVSLLQASQRTRLRHACSSGLSRPRRDRSSG